MKRAAGILFVTPDERVLLLRRAGDDHKGEWAFPGGGIEEGETPEQAARREVQEETGYTYDCPLTLWTRRIRDGVDFTTFLAKVDSDFNVTLNGEHDGHMWEPRSALRDGYPLHPGVHVALERFDMDELGIARAMQAGELVSPWIYGNLLLIKLRITGTGAAYRAKNQEFVWRDPSIYLNDEFLQRCNGLNVILEHPPEKPMLDSKEYKQRIVGSVFLPYIEGDEVWCVAKILEREAQEILYNIKEISTSPGVVFLDGESPGVKTVIDGATILIENKPSLLDHLAIVPAGVWDLGGEPSGVANEGITAISDSTTNEETLMPEEVATGGAADSSVNEKVLSALDSLSKRFDSFESESKSRHDSVCQRMDAFEKGGKVKEGGEATAVAADGSQTETQALTEERGENHLANNDSARHDAQAVEIKDLREQVAALRKMVPASHSAEDRKAFVAVQMEAEPVYQAFGIADGATSPLHGETLDEYRVRLARKHQVHSKRWKDVDLSTISGPALQNVVTQIYADAMVEARIPSVIEPGVLMERQEQDRTGRKITRFVGDPAAAWAPFKYPTRLVTGITTKFH